MPYVSQEQLNSILKKIDNLERWKRETEKKIDFLNTVKIEGRGRITLSGGHLNVNANTDIFSIKKGLEA